MSDLNKLLSMRRCVRRDSHRSVQSVFSDLSGDVSDLENLDREQVVLAEQLWSSCINKSSPICLPDGTPLENGWHFKASTSSLKNKSNKLVLRNGHKNYLAVICKEKMTPLVSIFKIYSPTPLTPGQKPAKKIAHSRASLYEWAEVISMPHKARHTLCLWNGTECENCYTSESDSTDAGEHVTFRKKGIIIGSMEKRILDIPSSDDAVLLLCFAAIIDELNQEGADKTESLQQQAEAVEGIVRRCMFAASEEEHRRSRRSVGRTVTPPRSRRSSWQSVLSSTSYCSSSTKSSGDMSLSEYLSQHGDKGNKPPTPDTLPCA